MKYLTHKDLPEVHPRFRHIVFEAWVAGENVPFSVKFVRRPKKISACVISKFFEENPQYKNQKVKNKPEVTS